MRVIICDLTGELPRARRQDLENRLVALGTAIPAIDAVEVDLETAGGSPASPRRRASVTLRAAHRRVVRVSDEAPSLVDALDQALSGVARERDVFGAGAPARRPLD